MNIFKEMAHSIYDFEGYKGFLKNKKGKVFLFGLVLMLAYFLVTMVVPFARFQFTTGGFGTIIREYVPDFELKDGKMWVESSFEYDYAGTYVNINTEEGFYFDDADQVESLLKEYPQVILMDSERAIVKNNSRAETVYFSDLSGGTFNKENLLGYVPYTYMIIAGFGLVALLVMIGLFFFGVLFVALLGMIFTSGMRNKLTFGQLYKLGIYARTLPLLIKAVLKLVSIPIPFFWVINFGISVFYLYRVIGLMKKDQEQPPQDVVMNQFDDTFK